MFYVIIDTVFSVMMVFSVMTNTSFYVMIDTVFSVMTDTLLYVMIDTVFLVMIL